ncbi:MAG TPA: hypothetical protein P5527_09410 [Kiritimatiellia bacterium]|nr:hypothetical protein [Kiritimatiellia bacterium]
MTGMLAMAMSAQELLPELAGPAAKYKEVVESLEKQKSEVISKAAQSYVSALDGIEKSATAKGDVDLIAAIVKEREAAVAGMLEEDIPSALPKARLYGTRRALQKKIAQIGNDISKRRKQVDANYLRTLATLQTKAAPDSDLAKQLAAEKKAVLAGGNRDAKKVSRGKNVVVNGDFEKLANDWPEGWDKVSRVMVVKENGSTFIRFEATEIFEDGSSQVALIRQMIDVPKGAQTVSVTAQLRTAGCVSHAKIPPIIPMAQVYFIVGEKEFHGASARWRKNDDWKEIRGDGAVLKNATKAYVQLVNGKCPGKIDFDDVEVTFK